MKILFAILLMLVCYSRSHGQEKGKDFYSLLKKLCLDSLEDMRDWGVETPNTYPIKWDKNHITMSDDLKINFYRTGMSNVTGPNSVYQWKVMVYGPRSGFNSFMLLGPEMKEFHGRPNLESVLGKNIYSYRLIKICDRNPAKGFYYYELKLPGKKLIWVKSTYACSTEGCSLRLTQYNEYTRNDVKLDCLNP